MITSPVSQGWQVNTVLSRVVEDELESFLSLSASSLSGLFFCDSQKFSPHLTSPALVAAPLPSVSSSALVCSIRTSSFTHCYRQIVCGICYCDFDTTLLVLPKSNKITFALNMYGAGGALYRLHLTCGTGCCWCYCVTSGPLHPTCSWLTANCLYHVAL